jgi:hypothetical protein
MKFRSVGTLPLPGQGNGGRPYRGASRLKTRNGGRGLMLSIEAPERKRCYPVPSSQCTVETRNIPEKSSRSITQVLAIA